MGTKSQWSNAHITLKRLWDQRIAPTGMSQEEFGEKYGIGTQAMVSQYLLGTRPLNYDAAAKFARGFDCTIEDICPEMARELAKEIVPVLGRPLWRRRLAVLALACTAPLLAPDHAQAYNLYNNQRVVYYVKSRARIMTVLSWLFGLPRQGYA